MSEGLPAPRRVDIGSIRERHNLTQGDLADYLHVDKRTIRRWERGEVAPLPMALAHIRRLQRQLNDAGDDRGGANGTGAGSLPSSGPAPHGASAGARGEATLPRRRLPSL